MTAFERLEAKLQQGVRRVLVVEDDQRQRDSIRQLLSSEGVEISDVATATEALERLKQTTFDCLVLDLSLPDLSGYEMLQRMAETDEVSFPPVIVYTGRSLTRDEEQRLRRFSRSIIIKDVRSPERLLDEVTLFLHQVESKLPLERQRMLREARDRESAFEGRRILIVEDDVRNIFALSKVLEPRGAKVEIARNGREALEVLGRSSVAAGTNDRPGADGHHDARDGRTDGHARDPQAPRVAEAADHRADRQGDEGRPGKMPAGRRQRLHRQATGCREAAVARPGLDGAVGEPPGAVTSTAFDIELPLLLEAIYRKYHYDFRGYAAASLKRRLTQAMERFGCRTLSQLQDRLLHEPALFPALLDFLTVQVSEMFRDPAYFRALREKVVPLLRTYPSLKIWVAGCSAGEEVYSMAILLHEEGLLERTLIYATDINAGALERAQAGIYDAARIGGFTENHRKSGARSSLSDYYTAAYGKAVFDKSLKTTSYSPTTAWPPTACSRKCSWSPAATC